MLACCVTDVPQQNSSFYDTWLSQKNIKKIHWGKCVSTLRTVALCTLFSNISAPRQKIEKNA